MTIDERRELVWADVTLNGEPARILGARQPYATVVQSATGLSATWAWGTAARIVASGGRFQT